MANSRENSPIKQLSLPWAGPSTEQRDVQTERVSDTIPESAQSLERASIQMEALTHSSRARNTGCGAHDQKRAELFAWGEAHGYWELNYCQPDGSLGRIRPGMHEWRAFIETANTDDFDLAWMSMDAWRADEANPDSLLQVPVVVKRRGVEDRALFMMTGETLGYPLVRFRANANGMVYHIQAGREVWLHRCLMATDQWLSWAIWAVTHAQNEEVV